MKDTVNILINKPDTYDVEENLYVGLFLEINIAGLSIGINDFIYQLQLDIQHLEDGTIQIGIGDENFTAIGGKTYTDFDEADDEDYNEYEFPMEEATRLLNYILYELPPNEEEIDEEEDTHDIIYHPHNPEKTQVVLDKIEQQEKLTEKDLQLLINNVKDLR